MLTPPYGLNFGAYKRTNKDRYGIRYKAKDWDKETPKDEYWEQLFGVSKNHKANLPFMGFELDEDYFKASVKRFEQYVSQKSLF